MPVAKEKLASLRAVLAPMRGAQERTALGVARLDSVLGGGLRRGAVHEIFAPASQEAAAVGFAAGLAVRLGGPVLWIVQDYASLEYGALSAPGLAGLGLAPELVLLVRVADVTSALRAAMDGLSCPALGSVLIEIAGDSKQLDLVAYRKLVLAAGQSGVTVLMLRFAAHPTIGVSETRWQIAAAPSAEGAVWGEPVLQAELQRNRAGMGGTFFIEWRCDDGQFRSADHRPVVCPAGDGPADPALAVVSAA